MSGLTMKQKNGITNMVCKNEDCHTPETNCPCTIIDQCECPTLKEVIETLAHYKDLEEQGRLIELPCKVGDTVWAADDKPVVPLVVSHVGVYLEGADGGDWESLSNFGKTVFLTKEEAEAKLAELRGTEE